MNRITLLCLVALGIAGCRAPAEAPPSLAEQLEAPIAELDAKLAALREADLPEPLAGMVGSQDQALVRVRQTGDPLLRLYRLRESWVDIHSLDYMAQNRDATSSQESFKALWDESASDIVAVAEQGGSSSSRLQRALVEAADNKASVLREASLAYARITSPESGLYYLAEARGYDRFADMVGSLEMKEPRGEHPPLSESAIARGFDEVDRQALEIFEENPTSGAAIPISALLKEGRALLDRGELYGAALALTESRMLTAMHRGETGAPAGPAAVTGRDPDSIEALLISMADEDEQRRAAINSAVLPFYQTLRGNPARAAARKDSAVVVTLVRWPYT